MRRNSRLVYSLFLSIGLALLFLSFILSSLSTTLPSEIIKDVGILVLSLALIDLLWNFVGGDPLSEEIKQLREINELNRDASETGLSRVFSRTGQFEQDLVQLYKAAKQNIELSGWSLYALADNKDLRDTFRDRAQQGVKIRVLLYDPSNPVLEFSADNAGNANISAVQEQMKYSWSRFQQIRGEIPEEFRENFEVKRLQSEILYYSVRCVDSTMSIIPYSFDLATPDSPLYVITGNNKPLFKSYMREFDALFQRAQSQ